MSDILSSVLKVNQPVNSGFDNNTVRNNPIVPGDTQIQNPVDPSKVVRPDGSTEAEDKRSAFAFESNFEKFVQTLKGLPQMTEIFTKLLFVDAQNILVSGLSEHFAEELSNFMNLLEMDQDQLLSFIKGQAADSGQFGGTFFQALKDVLTTTGSLELRTGILNFLKHYSDLASSGHLMNNIHTELESILPYMFSADAEGLKELVNHLIFRQDEPYGAEGQEGNLLNLMDSDIRHNGKVLKEEILPFLGGYINRTHDMGKPRDIITLLTLNIARYLNGSKENVMQSFSKLLQYGDFYQKLGDIKGENLELILDRLLSGRRDGQQDPWTQQLVSVIRAGLAGDGGHDYKVAFQNVMNAMLLNESVYMPLIHLMIPVNLNGNLMFSEMWIDPEAQNGGGRSGDEEEAQSIRMLIKFDIKDVGYFDLIMNCKDSDVDMAIAYPPRLSPAERQIRNGLSQILADNGLTSRSLTLEPCRKPVQLMDVFPKIAERRNSINVRI